MSPLTRFQRATVLIAAGDRSSAATELRAALTAIDKTGRDIRIRADLAQLLVVIERKLGSPDQVSNISGKTSAPSGDGAHGLKI
jgi:thioredoxin-like negative regulator of GroEL